MSADAASGQRVDPERPSEERADRWHRMVAATPTEGDDGAWVPLPENGWGAVVAWAAGPGRARPRRIALGDRRPVRVRCTEPDGTVREWDEPFTLDDLAELEDMIADYCALAGIPAPPVTAWDLRLPDADGMTLQDIDAAAFEEPTGHPAALIDVVRRVLAAQ